MKPVLVAYGKAALMLALSPFIALAAAVVVLVATWKAVFNGLIGVHKC